MQFRFDTTSAVDPEQVARNVASAKARRLPSPTKQTRPPLAIIGGGPSVNKYALKLKTWPGDIWACGSAFPWALEHGIKATFFNIDPLEEQAEYARGATKAILASSSHPRVFDAVPEVECFDLVNTNDYANHHCTAVTATPVLALEMGYTAVVYFGCESSFDGTTHAYKHENKHAKFYGVWVRVGDTVYPSSPGMLMQAQMLAEILRTCPNVFREASGGLLRALVKDPKSEIIAVNKTMHDNLNFTIGGKSISHAEGAHLAPILDMAL